MISGADIRYNMMTTSSLFREAQDEEMEHKVKKGSHFFDKNYASLSGHKNIWKWF
jgi:hypothetical protein